MLIWLCTRCYYKWDTQTVDDRLREFNLADLQLHVHYQALFTKASRDFGLGRGDKGVRLRSGFGDFASYDLDLTHSIHQNIQSLATAFQEDTLRIFLCA
jgi:hypothetical protein